LSEANFVAGSLASLLGKTWRKLNPLFSVITDIAQEQKPDEIRRVAVIVAHPDDETLWAGGLLLGHPEWSLEVVSLCRGSDPDRAPRFLQVLDCLNANGRMGDLDDGPGQDPLADKWVRDSIRSLLPDLNYDLVLTHAPDGEYTRHRRHEEVSRAVWGLWRDGGLRAAALLQFAYEDGGGAYLPRARNDACLRLSLSDKVWARKYQIMTEVYGFAAASWEARMVPRIEAFHGFGLLEWIRPLVDPPTYPP